MTKVYFVRHAQPEHKWEDDRTRPLTAEGKQDSKIVLDFLKDKKIDVFYSSPYQRSLDTIADTAAFYGKKMITDERLREREKGSNGNNHGMFEKRWADHDYHEENGESINMVQKRNIVALTEILAENKGKNIVIGTHGTALSTVLNFYNPGYCIRIKSVRIDWSKNISFFVFGAKGAWLHFWKNKTGNLSLDFRFVIMFILPSVFSLHQEKVRHIQQFFQALARHLPTFFLQN